MRKERVNFPDGRSVDVDVDDNGLASPEELARVQAMMSAGNGALVDPDAQAPVPPPDGRNVALGMGGAVGGVTGALTGGPPGAVSGALQGMALAGVGYDALSGDPNFSRNMFVGLTDALLTSHPMTKSLRMAGKLAIPTLKEFVAHGALSAGAGAYFDHATGREITPESVTGDAAAGVIGQGVGAVVGKLESAAQARRLARGGKFSLPSQTDAKTWMDAEGITSVPVSGRTNSKMALKVERLPRRQMFGSGTGGEYLLRGLEQAEDATVRTLDRIDALAADKTPTAMGAEIRRAALDLRKHRNNAARQGYAYEASLMPGAEVHLGNLRTVAQRMADEQARLPGGVNPVVEDILARTAPVDPVTGVMPGLPWQQARMVKARLGNKAFGSNHNIIANMTEGEVKVLHDAIDMDLHDVVSQYPKEVQDVVGWTDQAYGLTNDAIKKRILRSLDHKDAEQNLKNLFDPKKLEETKALRALLPREVWDRSAAAWLADVYAKAGGSGRPGLRPTKENIPRFKPRMFARLVKPFLDSGQIDEMFPARPTMVPGVDASTGQAVYKPTDANPTAEWIKSFVQYGERHMSGAEEYAGTLLNTGQSTEEGGQARKVAKGLVSLLALPVAVGGALGATGAGDLMQSVGAGVGALAIPAGANFLAYTRPGQKLMTRAINGPDPTALGRELFVNGLLRHEGQSQKERYQR